MAGHGEPVTPLGEADASAGVAIGRSPLDVWTVVSDVRRMPEWRPRLEGLFWHGEPGGVGATFEGRSSLGPFRKVRLVCRVTEWEPPSRFRYEVVEGPVRADALWGIRPEGDGSYLFSAGDIVGNTLATRLLRPVLRPLGMRELRAELRRLEELLEVG